jgi:hypothetical protein
MPPCRNLECDRRVGGVFAGARKAMDVFAGFSRGELVRKQTRAFHPKPWLEIKALHSLIDHNSQLLER